MVDIVNLGFGNIESVSKWLKRNSFDANIIDTPKKINSDLVILPGVGAAEYMMRALTVSSFDVALKKHVQDGNRLFGICLGFQILFQNSEEGGSVETLGLLRGLVKKLPNNGSNTGWLDVSQNLREFNEYDAWRINCVKQRKKTLKGRFFYNHEYGVVADNSYDQVKISEDLCEFSAMLVSENVAGVQFHPEKSQNNGDLLAKMLIG